MTKQSPIKRAARALAEELAMHLDLDDASFEPVLEKAARAMLMAVREPSPKMIDAGAVAIAKQFTDPWDVLSPDEEEALGLKVDGEDAFEGANVRLAPFSKEAWQAMIDAALEE